jgi:hypothetical protein
MIENLVKIVLKLSEEVGQLRKDNERILEIENGKHLYSGTA